MAFSIYEGDAQKWHLLKTLESLSISEIQIKSPLHPLGWLSSKGLISSVGEGVEKFEPKYTVGSNVKICSCFGKQSGSSSKVYAQSYYMTQHFHL